MKKNLLFSLIAMSAAPMTAFADANVELDVNKDSKVWSTENGGDKFSISEDGIIHSPKAAHVTRQITLLPGTYRLSAIQKEGAKLQFATEDKCYADKHEILADDGQDLVLKKETTVWVRVSAAVEGQAFSVSGLKLMLVYSLTDAAKELEIQLGAASSQLAETGKFNAALTTETSRLAGEVLKIKNADNQENAYQIYKDNKFYLGVEQSPLVPQIKKLAGQVADAVQKVQWHDAAVAAIQTIEANLNALNWEMQSDYIKALNQKDYDALVELVANFKNGVEAYDTNEKYGDKYNSEKTKQFINQAQKDCDKLKSALNGGQEDDAAYKEVSGKIDIAKKNHLAYVQQLVEIMGQDKELAPVYEKMRSEAQQKLAEAYNKVMACNAIDKNGTAEKHDKAAETKDANLKSIEQAEAEMLKIRNDYEKKYNDNIKAYKLEVEAVAGYRKQLTLQPDNQLNEEAKKLKAEAENLIDAFEKKIVADHSSYTSFAADYKADKAAIDSKLKAFAEKAGLDTANFAAHGRLVKLQGDKQKEFDKVKSEVNALASKDGKYAVNGKYVKAEESLQKKLTDYKTAIDKTVKEGAVDYELANKSSIEALSSEFKIYKDNAVNTMKHYEEVSAALASQNDTVNDLRNLVKVNDKVVVSTTKKTYGETVVELQDRINAVQKVLDEALGKKGEEHRSALNAVSVDVKIEEEVTALLKSYEGDKKYYDEQQSVNAAKAVQTSISNKIKEATDYLAEMKKTCTKEVLGLKLAEVTDSLAKIEVKIDAENDKNSVVITPDNALERLAALNEVSVTVDGIKTEIYNYNEKVVKVYKANLLANKDKYNQLVSPTEPKGLLVVYQDRVAKIASKDADHQFTKGEGENIVKVTVNGQKAKLVSSLSELLNDINTSNSKENVVTDAKDTVDKDGKVTKKGFDSRLSDILKGIKDVEQLAKDADANLAAKNALEKLKNDKDFVTLKKNADAAVAKATGDAVAYYTGVVAEYQKAFEQIVLDITKAYNENKSVESKAGLETRINSLAVNLSDVVTDVPANEKAHNSLIESGKATEGKWSEAYNHVMEHDKTTKRQEHLDALAAVQKKMLDNDLVVEDDFSKGLSEDNKVKRQNVYNEALSEIAAVMATQNPDKYNPVVLADNKLYLQEFNKLIAEARASFKIAAETIRAYNTEIVHEELQTAIAPVIEANKGIFDYGTALDKFDGEVQNAWNKCVAETPDQIFDATKENLQKTKDQKASIDAAVTKLQTEANGVVAKVMQEKYNYAKGLMNEAIAEMQSPSKQIDQSIIDASFKKVKDLLKVTDPAKAPKEDPNYALTCDRQIEGFAEVSRWISNDQIEAGHREWSRLDAIYSKKIKEEREELKGFAYLPSYIESNGQPLERYNSMVEQTYERAKNYAGWDAYYQMYNIKWCLKRFDNSTIFSDAKAASQNKAVNDEKLSALNDSLNKSGLAEIKAYAEDYVVGGQKTWIDDYEMLSGKVGTLSSSLQSDYNSGMLSSKAHYDSRNKEINDLIAEIARYYKTIDNLQYVYLVEQLGLLRGEYNSAVGEGNLNGEDRTAFESRINAVAKKLDDASKETKEKANHKVFMECESEIAIMLTDLRNYYDAESIVKVTTDLNAGYNKVLGDYNRVADYLSTTHVKVQKRFEAALGVVKADLDEAKNMLDTKISDRTILFFQKNIQLELDKVSVEVLNAGRKLAAAQSPYDIHQNVYEEKSGYLAKCQNELDRVWKLIESWNLTDAYDVDHNVISNLIDVDKNGSLDMDLEGLESWYKHDQDEESEDHDLLTGSYELISESLGYYLKSEINSLERKSSEDKINIAFNILSSKLSSASRELNGFYYFSEKDRLELSELLSKYSLSVRMAWNYYNNIKRGYTDVDVEGNSINFEDYYCSYLECYHNVLGKQSEISKDVEELLANIELKRVVVGDMDNDKNVHVNDYSTILRAALGQETYDPTSREFLCADVDENGKINIGDVTAMVNLIRGVSRVNSAMYLHPLSATPVMTDNINMLVEGEGVNQRIAINLNNTNSFVGAQMDIYLPEGVRLVGESCGDRAVNHELYSNDLENGAHRIILSSLDNAEFEGNEGAVIYLDVEVNHSYNGEGIGVKNVMFTDAAARIFNLNSLEEGQATGINKVTLGDTVVNKVYNVGGQLVKGVQKGVNIILMKDGTVKKVLKK